MKELADIADQLNLFLDDENIDETQLDDLMWKLRNMGDVRIKLLDFEKYTESGLEKLTESKMRKIKDQDFEGAANLRLEEKECLKYMNFQKYFQLKKSLFYPEGDKLFYFHLGNGRNDAILKNIFSLDIPTVKIPKVERG